MRTREAAAYLGWSRQAVYDRVSRKGMPHYKVDGMLLFKRDELDAWLAADRQEVSVPEPFYVRPATQRRRRTQPSARSTTPLLEIGGRAGTRLGDEGKKKRKRERPLPPPLGGDEEHKNHWARELEITRADLDEMSPKDFDRAWEARNRRLEDGGVFDHLRALEDAHGWAVIDKMTPSELIQAVADLGLAPERPSSAGPPEE